MPLDKKKDFKNVKLFSFVPCKDWTECTDNGGEELWREKCCSLAKHLSSGQSTLLLHGYLRNSISRILYSSLIFGFSTRFPVHNTPEDKPVINKCIK